MRTNVCKRAALALPWAMAAIFLAGCATDAGMSLAPGMLAQAEAIDVAGIGGWKDGSFRLGGSRGRFTRRSIQIRTDDPHIRNVGGARFEAIGPDFGGQAMGDCGFDERQLDWGSVMFPEGRLTYTCTFLRNGKRSGGLLLAEVPNGAGALAGITRAGQLWFDGATLAVRAVHEFRNARIRSGTPLGYSFSVAGREVGAVDLNGRKTIYLPRAPGPERDAVLMAGVALMLFWDPGD